MKVGPSDSLNIWPWLFLSLLSSEQTGRVRFSSLSRKTSAILHSVLREIICIFESNSDKNQRKFWTWFKHLQFHAKMVYLTEFFKNAYEYLSQQWAVCTFEGNKEKKLNYRGPREELWGTPDVAWYFTQVLPGVLSLLMSGRRVCDTLVVLFWLKSDGKFYTP